MYDSFIQIPSMRVFVLVSVVFCLCLVKELDFLQFLMADNDVKIDVKVTKSFLLKEFKRITGHVNTFSTDVCTLVLESICDKHHIEFHFVVIEKVLPTLKSYLKKLISNHDKTKKRGGKQYQRLLEVWDSEHYHVKIFVTEICLPDMHTKLKNEKSIRKSLMCRYKSAIKKAKHIQSQKMVLKKRINQLNAILLERQTNKSVRPFRVLSSNDCLSRSQLYKRNKMLLTECKQSLEFMGRYEMEALSVQVKKSDGSQMSLSLKDSTPKEDGPIVDLDGLIFVKDSENISNKAYHELSMIVPTLPRSHTVTKRMKEHNANINIVSTPNDVLGVQQSLKDRLTSRISQLITSGKGSLILDTENVNVKLTGDGTDLGRRKKLVNFGFTILDDEQCVSVKGNYLLAMFSANESYENVQKALEDVITEAKALEYIYVQDVRIHVTYYLGGDLKFLNMVSGIASCASTFSCVWCKCPAADRYDMEKSWSVTDVSQGARTVEEISAMANRKGKRYNCVKPPLFDFIPLVRIVPDILHLRLRLSDQLVKHLISYLRVLDNIDRCTSRYDKEKCKNVFKFETFVRSCGIDFHFRNDKESGRFLFRGFTGPEHKIISERINLSEFIPNHPKRDKIIHLWGELSNICTVLGKERFEPFEYITLDKRFKGWVQCFGQVYQSKDITPYMHILAFHASEMIRQHGSLCKFSQQGFEKLNDNATSWFFRSTSHRGQEALRQVMLKQNRLEMLENSKRIPRENSCSLCHGQGHNMRSCETSNLL